MLENRFNMEEVYWHINHIITSFSTIIKQYGKHIRHSLPAPSVD